MHHSPPTCHAAAFSGLATINVVDVPTLQHIDGLKSESWLLEADRTESWFGMAVLLAAAHTRLAGRSLSCGSSGFSSPQPPSRELAENKKERNNNEKHTYWVAAPRSFTAGVACLSVLLQLWSQVFAGRRLVHRHRTHKIACTHKRRRENRPKGTWDTAV
jgi:hypothetical protein